MSIFHYIPLVGGLLNFALSLFVLGCDRRSRLNQVFAAWGVSVATWNLGTYAMFQVKDAQSAFLWAKFLQYGVILIPPTLLHLSLMLAGKKVKHWIFALYGLHAVLGIMNFTGHFISGVRDLGYAYYSIAGPGFWIYAASLSQTFVSVYILWQKRQSLPERMRGRFNGILLAQTLIVVLGTNDILPILGVDFYPFTGIPVRPYGSLAAAAYGVMVAYSVFQHQLLDVHLALGRSAAYVLRFVFLLLIAVVLQLTVAAFSPPGEYGVYSFVTGTGVIVVAALIASFLFPKLLGGTAEELERRLLGDHFEYQDQIRAFTESSRWKTDMPTLLQDLHQLLVNTLRVRAYWVIVLDETNRAYSLVRTHPAQPERQLEHISADSPLFRYFLESKQGYLALNPSYWRTDENKLEDQAREQLKQFVGEFAFPLIMEQQPMGVLVLGEKINQAPFTGTDTRLLSTLAENMALVVHGISLKNHLLLNQELDLLGRMSRGMAHDLNNLITPVWTLLQLMGEGEPAEVLKTELVPVAMRNIHTMRAYIKEALFFSEHLRPDFQFGRLDVLVAHAVDMARENKRKGKLINYIVETGGEALVEMDQVLIQRLVANVISNAVDASPNGGEIRVEIIRLVKTDTARDWLRVRVTDHGTGIRPEHLDRLFQPYFTTKKTGDEERGFGLGLAICRKIATLHNGHLSVTSTVGKGTSVNLDLPNRQKPERAVTQAQTVSPSPQPASP